MKYSKFCKTTLKILKNNFHLKLREMKFKKIKSTKEKFNYLDYLSTKKIQIK